MDTLVGLVILGVFVVTLLGSISTGFLGLVVAQDASVAESLARSQLEYIKAQNYQQAGGYITVTAPTGYSVVAGVGPIPGSAPNTIQQIVVTVYRGVTVVKVITDFKANR